MDNVIQVRQNEDVTVITLVFNEINLSQREEIKVALQKELLEHRTKFVIDLSRVGFVSSIVLAVLVFFLEEVTTSGGSLQLCGVSDDAMDVFRVTQLDGIFEFHDTVQDAIESLKRS